jgi:hypothetical protein
MRPELVGYPNEFRSTLVAPGRIRPHLEEGRNAGAHPERKRSEDLAKPRVPNRQLSVNSGTLLRTRCGPSLVAVCCSPPDVSPSSFLPWLL